MHMKDSIPSNMGGAAQRKLLVLLSVQAGIIDRDQALDVGLSARQMLYGPFEGHRFGDLTIRDVTREVTLHGEFNGLVKSPWGDERVGFSAKTSIDRREFGLGWNKAIEAGGVVVGDKVDIEIEVELIRAKA